MKNSTNENESLLQIKKQVSKTIVEYSVIPEKEIKELVNACFFLKDADVDTHRTIINYNCNYYHLKASNVIFHPIKFIKLLLSIGVLLADFNYLSVINIFCDVLNVISVTLSLDEASVLLCLYRISNIKNIDDCNIYNIYLEYISNINSSIMDKGDFFNTLQKLIDKRLVILEDGNYYVNDKIIVKDKKG